jgi:flagellar hook-basal body complex protein FliE
MTDPVGGIPMMRITPPVDAPSAAEGAGGSGGDFGTLLRSAMESAVDTGHAAEAQAVKAITQGGNVTEVVTALARAELTLQTATAVRDRMLQAYQDIMRIQI